MRTGILVGLSGTALLPGWITGQVLFGGRRVFHTRANSRQALLIPPGGIMGNPQFFGDFPVGIHRA